MPDSARIRFQRAVKRHGGVKGVASDLDVTIGHISMLQNGKRLPSGQLAAEIQRLYNIPAALWFKSNAA